MNLPVFTVREYGIEHADLVLDLVWRLLEELGEEAHDLGSPDRERIMEAWRAAGDGFMVLAAFHPDGHLVGIVTLFEAFAIYAHGRYGIINEMVVEASWRSLGAGRVLVDAAKYYGRRRGWSRIDVTAPVSERWARTRLFYEREGFEFTGPKLRCVL